MSLRRGALPYAFVLLLFAGVVATESSHRAAHAQFVAACLLATLNLAYLASMIVLAHRAMGFYRQMASAVPAGMHPRSYFTYSERSPITVRRIATIPHSSPRLPTRCWYRH